MAVENGWGQGAVNNSNDYGKAKANSTNGFGKIYESTNVGLTNTEGGDPVVSISYAFNSFCANASDPTPTVSNNAGAGTFSSTTGLVINSTTGVIDIDASTASTYTVTYTDTDSATAIFDLTIHALPTVIVSVSAGTICVGESTTITATGAASYSWSNGSTGNSITVSPTTTTTFTATGTDSNGCTNTGATTITVNALPSVSISGTLTYCAGASTTLDAGSFASYSWSSGETTQTISATAGNYTVTVTDSNGCSNTSAQVTVTELALPTVAISGTLSYCAGLNTTLTATAGLSSYLWSSGETTQSITATAGSYTVTGTDSNGCSNTSSSVTVTETPLDNAGFSYSASSYEPTDADPTPTITGLTGGTFSGTTGLVINSTTGEIDLSASTVASHTITYDTTSSGSSVCPNTSTQTVEIAVAGIANNYSMSFDGSNDYIDSSSFSALNSGTAVTVSLWFKSSTYSTNGRAISNNTIEIYQASSAYSNTQGRFYYRLRGNYGNSFAVLGGTSASGVGNLVDGNWHHLCVTFNNSITTAKVYEDGIAVVTNTSASGTLNSVASNLYIGSSSTTSDFIDGQIDEVGIWNTALTSTQVAEIYNATGTNLTKDLTTVSGSNLVYWNRMGD